MLVPLREPAYLEAPVHGSPDVVTTGATGATGAAGARYLEAPRHMALGLNDQLSRHLVYHACLPVKGSANSPAVEVVACAGWYLDPPVKTRLPDFR